MTAIGRHRSLAAGLLATGLAVAAFFGARALADERPAAPDPAPVPEALESEPALVRVAELTQPGAPPALRRPPRRPSTASNDDEGATRQQQQAPQGSQAEAQTTPQQTQSQTRTQPDSGDSGGSGSQPVDPNPSE